jgi:N-dimethylarginine dimethylaminohydrolase
MNAHFLMCRPQHFAVAYTINPWMDPASWARDDRALAAASRREWTGLERALRDTGARVDLVPSTPRLPDLVFTANAAVVLDGKALLARFRYPERQAEEPHFEAAFRQLQGRGVIHTVRTLPDGLARSDAQARHVVAEEFAPDVIALELADERFYHMDTALCPLTGGEVIVYPGAFTPAGRAAIAERVGPDERIEISFDDASRLAANAVCVGHDIVLSYCSDALRARLAERGYRVTATPLDSFLRSGGSAFCLTLRLDRRSAANAVTLTDTAA